MVDGKVDKLVSKMVDAGLDTAFVILEILDHADKNPIPGFTPMGQTKVPGEIQGKLDLGSLEATISCENVRYIKLPRAV